MGKYEQQSAGEQEHFGLLAKVKVMLRASRFLESADRARDAYGFAFFTGSHQLRQLPSR